MSATADPWDQLTATSLGDDSDSASDFSDSKIAAGNTDNEYGDSETDQGSDDESGNGAGPAEPVPPAKPAKAKPVKAKPVKAKSDGDAAKPAKGQKRKAPADKPESATATATAVAAEGKSDSTPSAAKTPKKRVKTAAASDAATGTGAAAGSAGPATTATSAGPVVLSVKSDKAAKAKARAKPKNAKDTTDKPSDDAGASAPALATAPEPAAVSDPNDVVVIAMDIIDRGFLRIQGPFDKCVAKIRSLLGDTKRSNVWVRNFQMYVPRCSPRFSTLVGSAEDEQRTLCSFSVDEPTRMPPSLDSIIKFAELDMV